MQFLDEEKVRSLLTYETLIPAVERALTNLSTGKIQQPVRTVLRIPDPDPAPAPTTPSNFELPASNFERPPSSPPLPPSTFQLPASSFPLPRGFFALMPAVDEDIMGVKLVTFYERNTTLPTHQAIIQLLDAHTGEPLVAMDGRLITEMRTAAVSAIATRLFAPVNTHTLAGTLAILGSGVQARSHLQALRLVRNFPEVRVWSRTPANAQRLAAEFNATAVPTPEAAVRGADVVLGLASVREPLILGDWLGPQTFVCAVATVTPDRRELDDEAMNAAIVVESCQAALRESGDIIGSGAPVYAEIGEILAGATPLPQGRVVFKSLGVAACDLAAAGVVWQVSKNRASP
jgi:ornithine cyclodeaminase/alanine dehydrogenase-like protein (mu-crystallin family)